MIKEGSKPADSCSTVRISLRRAQQPAGLPGTFGFDEHDGYDDDHDGYDDHDNDRDKILFQTRLPSTFDSHQPHS